MTLSLVVPILGPPASGKTTLTLALGRHPDRHVFRLREHVPPEALVATVGNGPHHLGWIDECVVAPAVRAYLQTVSSDPRIHTVLMDNYPGTADQVRTLIDIIESVSPRCAVEPVELLLDPKVRRRRAQRRRVCHRCEHDPAADPRIPATPSRVGGWICANCHALLHTRRGDAPSLFAARSRRHEDSSDQVRAAFGNAGVAINTLDAIAPASTVADLVEPLLISRSKSA